MSFHWLIRETRLAALLLALVIFGGCAAPVSNDGADSAGDAEKTGAVQQAITNGEDDDADPAVVALLLGGKVFCSGALVTGNVVVTAAHCVSPTPPDQVYFGSKPNPKRGTFIKVTESHAHPDFDADTLENDIALVVLETRAPVAPINVLTADFDSSYVGMSIRLVGYGATSGSDDGNLRKRTGNTKIKSFTDDDFRFVASPSQTCVGDSGGVALADFGDHESIVGITSSGDSDCKVYGRDMRIDRYVPFIHSYAKAYSARMGAAAENKGCSVSRTPTSRTSRSDGAVMGLVALAALLLLKARRERARRA